MLKEMEAATQRVAIHLCNVTSVGFEKAGFCTSDKIAFDVLQLTYGEALLEAIHKSRGRFWGHGCVQRSYSPLCNGGVYQLQLRESLADEEERNYGN